MKNTPLLGSEKNCSGRRYTSGFSIPFISVVAGVPVAAAFIIAQTAAYSVSEYFRLKGRNFPILSGITKMAMRDANNADEERQNTFVRAPPYFAAGILVSLLIFPAPFNYAAIAVVTDNLTVPLLSGLFISIIGRL